MNWLLWVLRIGVFGIFFGHGIFAIQVKESWLGYLQFVGINAELSRQILPIIGCIDLVIAFSVLIKPWKPILLYATCWAFAAALIRPITGEPIWDFIERAGNWVTPLSLFLLLKIRKTNNEMTG